MERRLRTRTFAMWRVLGLMILLGLATVSGAELLTGVVRSIDGGAGFDKNLLVGVIPGRANMQVRIMRLGIGGDADQSSGKQAFQAIGAGLSFTWGAGQEVNPPFPLDYVLSPTTQTGSPNGRSLSYSSPLDLRGMAGQSISIKWRGTADWDGRFTQDTDILGNAFDDAPYYSSARAWVQYDYLPVPEPGSLAGLALISLVFGRRYRKTGG